MALVSGAVTRLPRLNFSVTLNTMAQVYILRAGGALEHRPGARPREQRVQGCSGHGGAGRTVQTGGPAGRQGSKNGRGAPQEGEGGNARSQEGHVGSSIPLAQIAPRGRLALDRHRHHSPS